MGANSKIEWCDHIDPNATGRTLGAYKSAAKKIGCSLTEWLSNRAAGKKWCFRCRSWKPGIEFSLDGNRSGGRSSICKDCNSRCATASRYGMSHTELESLREAQSDRCLICHRETVLVVDHDHSTGEVRGLLCTRCNVGLGHFEDNPALMRAAIAYLERFNG